MEALPPELLSNNDEAVLYGFIALVILCAPIILIALGTWSKAQEQREAKHISELSEEEINQIASGRATSTVFFLLALFVVFALATIGGAMEPK